jgi:hypothetical protein
MVPGMRLAVAALVLALPAVAFAQAPGMYDPTPPVAPPGMTPPAADRDEPPHPAAQPSAQAPTGLAAFVARDPAADRAFGTSTAVALPSGKIDISGRASYFGGMGSIAAGLGSGIEVSADIGGITGEHLNSFGGGVKIVVAHGHSVSLAATASYHHMTDHCGDCMDTTGLWSVGGVLSSCVGSDCSGVVSVGGGLMGVTESDSDSIPYLNASLIAGSGSFRPILEGAALLGSGGGILGFGGARIGGKTVAVDAGIGFLLADGGDGAGAVPMLGLSVSP